jgi:hypothetical protein
MGYSDAGRVVGWMSNFLAGLYTSGDQGLDPSLGVAYGIPVRDAKKGRLLNTWREAYENGELSYIAANRKRETFDDYAMIMRSALAGGYSVTRSAKTAQAYRYLSTNLGRISNSTTRGDPTFAILPAAEPPTAP